MLRRSPSLPDCPWYLGGPFALTGFVLLILTAFGAQSLSLGTVSHKLVIGFCFLILSLIALYLLWRSGCPTGSLLLLVLPISIMLYLRLCLLDHQTQDYQMFLSQWVTFFRENGGFGGIRLSVGDYNVPYLYFLAAISYSSVPDLYLIKLFSVLFDVLLAWSALRLSRHFCRENSPLPLVCFTAFLFLPTFVLNGAYWGQCDSLYAALILLAIEKVLDGHPNVSVLLLSVAFSFKLQTVFLIPLWCVFWFTKRVKFKHLLLFPAGYLVTILPALALGKPLKDILSIYVSQTSEYNSRLTLNAPSVFSLLPYGSDVDVSLASRAGIIAAFAFLLIVLALLFLKRKYVNNELILTAAVVMAIGIPFLLPHMHERYFFLAGAVSLMLGCVNPRFLPIALLAEVSSLSSYSTYLTLRYTLPFPFGGQYYVMAFEGLVMLAALIWSLAVFAIRLKRAKGISPAPSK